MSFAITDHANNAGIDRLPRKVSNHAMDSLAMIKSRLGNATWAELKVVAEFTGVPFHTLRKVIYGETVNPRYQTVEPLRRYVESIPQHIER